MILNRKKAIKNGMRLSWYRCGQENKSKCKLRGVNCEKCFTIDKNWNKVGGNADSIMKLLDGTKLCILSELTTNGRVKCQDTTCNDCSELTKIFLVLNFKDRLGDLKNDTK